MSEVKQYRKKPVVIEAMQLTAEVLHEGTATDWSNGKVKFGAMSSGAQGQVFAGHVLIDTLEGTMRADLGDYIIRGVQGEFYPCKPDIFEATYEAVSRG